ncbi:F(420)H(2) dehydrogenase subunit N [Candidatus Methanoperedenaceae archaeon GB50]|nr:F(420)H(2) dehydrogenase subunit N [Candidatus Methanoperedenaceae archaeon GB50]
MSCLNYPYLTPELIVVIMGLVVVFLGLFIPTRFKKGLGCITGLTLIVAIADILRTGVLWESQRVATYFYDAYTIDPFSQFFKLVFLAVSFIVVIASIRRYREDSYQDEYYGLLLFATLGMMVVASANDLLTLFIGFELASMSTYALAGFNKTNPKSVEAAMKYYVIGSVSSAILLFGFSLLYGATGTTNLEAISAYIGANGLASTTGIAILIFLIAGFTFKMALVPFHMWAPDTYEGSPTLVSALLAAGSKKMGFAAAFKVFLVALIALKLDMQNVFFILAIITMTYGNLVAISQKSIKRMLAYSSVAQAGYISMALVIMTPLAMSAGILYVLSHAFMKTGAFIATGAVVYMLTQEKKDLPDADYIDNFAGLSKRAPLTAFAMMIFVFALAGIPPTAGFVSKFVLFSSAIHAGYITLVVVAILNSALSLYYYARLVKYMYVLPPAGERLREPRAYLLAMLVAVIIVIAIGVYPAPFLQWAMNAAVTIGL